MSFTKQKYPPTRTIFVDVDGTLHVNGVLNQRVVDFCRQRKAEGFTINLWSARGKQHAVAAATHFGITDIFDVIVSKPGYVVDDLGWQWIKYTRVVTDLRVAPPAPPGVAPE